MRICLSELILHASLAVVVQCKKQVGLSSLLHKSTPAIDRSKSTRSSSLFRCPTLGGFRSFNGVSSPFRRTRYRYPSVSVAELKLTVGSGSSELSSVRGFAGGAAAGAAAGTWLVAAAGTCSAGRAAPGAAAGACLVAAVLHSGAPCSALPLEAPKGPSASWVVAGVGWLRSSSSAHFVASTKSSSDCLAELPTDLLPLHQISRSVAK